MDKQDPAVKELVERMKATARAHAAPPLGPPRECYHEFASGLRLCLTVDVLTADWISQVSRLIGAEVPEVMVEHMKYWHLSITRVGVGAPMHAEVEFWRRAFFEEPPLIGTGGVLPGVHSRHFFWKYE